MKLRRRKPESCKLCVVRIETQSGIKFGMRDMRESNEGDWWIWEIDHWESVNGSFVFFERCATLDDTQTRPGWLVPPAGCVIENGVPRAPKIGR